MGSYGLQVKVVYDDGSMYDPAVLDITDDDILASFASGIKNVAAVSIETGIPTVASVPYSILLAFKNLLAIAAETDYTFPQAESLKEYLANPAADAPKEEAKKEESESEDDGE